MNRRNVLAGIAAVLAAPAALFAQESDIMIDKDQFRLHVIRKPLQDAGLWSPEAEELLMGTAAHESHLGTYVAQKGGPALGVFQVEPATHQDIWDNFLAYQPGLLSRIDHMITRNPEDMVYDMRHACIMARLVYYRQKEKLPRADLLNRQAYYWKKYYNTIHGSGTEQKYITDYVKFVA